jgi:hypothetical protein
MIKLSLFISDIIFSGSKIFIPVLVIIRTIFPQDNSGRVSRGIRSLNLVLLSGSILFLLAFLTDNYLSFHSQERLGWEFMVGVLTGPHWYQIVLPVFGYAVLPQMLWWARLRRSVYSSFTIFLFWLFGYLFIIQMAKSEYSGLTSRSSFIKNSLSGYLEVVAIYIPLFIIVYLVSGWINSIRGNGTRIRKTDLRE